MSSGTVSFVGWALCFTLVGCGAREHTATMPSEPEVVAEEPEVADDEVEVASAEPAPVPEIVEEPVDHRASPCFTDVPAAEFVTRTQREGVVEAVTHSSIRPSRNGDLRAPPGSVVRVEVTLENVGNADLTISESTRESLRVVNAPGGPLPITTPSELRVGQRVVPGAMLRLCVEFDVGQAPLVVSPRTDGVREYLFGWSPFVLETGHPIYLGGPNVVTRYVVPSARRRERDSWGGVISLQLAEGASLLQIARQTGVQIGSRVPLFESRDAPRPGSVARPTNALLVEAPAHMTVAEAVTALTAFSGVISAVPLFQGDPGTEGCSENSPCAPGLVCGYPCGIAGCPHACMTREEARVRRP